MGGKLRVTSEPGKGSKFSFDLPITLQNQEKEKEFIISEEFKESRVLVVDDNLSSCEILQELLDSWSFENQACNSGQAALKELVRAAESGEKPYNLILMDWMMPKMDGVETAIRIQEVDNLPDAPTIIMVSAYKREEVMLRAEEAKLSGFVNKPVDPSSLFDAIMVGFGKSVERTRRPLAGVMGKFPNLEAIRGASILLVEDYQANQEVAQGILEQHGFQVMLVNNGQEAVVAVMDSEVPFDLVLMDLQMPIMDGYQATRKIRESSELKDLPIIAMTASAMIADVEKCLASGMNDHVAKPIEINSFFRTLLRWIKPGVRSPVVIPPREQADDTGLVLPDHLEGFDLAEGLLRFGGDHSILARLLSNFGKSHGDVLDKVRQAVECGELDQARRLVHGLSGVVGNISAKELHAAAIVLEDCLVDGNLESILSHLESFGQAFEKVLTSTATLTSAQNRTGKQSSSHNETGQDLLPELSSLVAELDGYLKKNDFRSQATLEILSDLLKNHEDKTIITVGKLEDAMKRLDSKEGRRYLRILAEELGIPGINDDG